MFTVSPITVYSNLSLEPTLQVENNSPLSYTSTIYMCSECHYCIKNQKTNYCPNCGAIMETETDLIF